MNDQAFQDMDRSLKGETVVTKLGRDFDILSQVCKVQSQLPPTSLEESHNLEVLAQEMQAYEIPNKLQWEDIEKFSKLKYSTP